MSMNKFEHHKFETEGELHRNILLETLENEHGFTFRDYDLSTVGITATNQNSANVLKSLFTKETI
jgi:hypothetical protein